MAHAASARHGRRARGLRVPAVVMLVLSLAGCSGVPGVYVVEKAGRASSGAGGGGKFNATAYAEQVWASKVVPTAQKNAQDAATLLPALRADQQGAGARYGKQAGAGSPYSFLIKGTGTVKDVTSGNAVGSIQLDVPGAGKTDVNLAIGPAFVGTAVRDAVGFIGFGQFNNQIDYADAAAALNNKVKTTVVRGLDPASVKGKKVTFTGAFQLVAPSSVMITPITLEVAP
ncbi:DUF2291 family protein [Actinomadura sp. WMMA1423]|uniref:DUF2291 family protein n=1 Tax=Actinomadura sp. WMMA1423 TaxID=2591108 RepID=UPI001146BD6A|nr:DUF2291 domain-containing protein [Actinomadura sp. WMMA1423]